MTTASEHYFFRLISGNVLIIALVFTVAGVVSYHSLNAAYLHEIETHQLEMTGVAKEFMESLCTSDEQADRLCKQFVAAAAAHPAGSGQGGLSEMPLRLTVIAADGRVLGDSHSDPAAMPNHKTADRPEVIQALEGQTGVDTRKSGTLAIEYRYVAMPLSRDGHLVGAVRVAMPVVAITHVQTVVRNILLWTGIVSVVAFALLGALVEWVWQGLKKRA
jgi:hypothetical protein